MSEELYKYYNLEEVTNRKPVINKLNKLKAEGKIEFDLDVDLLKIEDIDLDISELDNLIKFFDKYDVFKNLDIEEDEENFDDYYQDEDEY